MPRYKVLRDHLSVGSRELKKGEIVEEELFGANAQQLVDSGRLERLPDAAQTKEIK